MFASALPRVESPSKGLSGYLVRLVLDLLTTDQGPVVDFSAPKGEPALSDPYSLSWQVFRNPISLFIGGVTGVVLELAEPRVRSGVWDHTSFRTDPMRRLKRTGLAAMVTVYGAQSQAKRMISAISALHSQVSGYTPAGAAYCANDTHLLDWVQATASYGFLEAYGAYVRPISDQDRSHFLAECMPAARLYGATGAPKDLEQRRALFSAMMPLLEPSPILFEFLTIMTTAKVFPAPLRGLQSLLVKAGIDLIPMSVRQKLDLGSDWTLSAWQKSVIHLAARSSEKLFLPSSPPVQACHRLGLDPRQVFLSPKRSKK
jgi:uncharacterized protein (DUF2236 family)